MSFEGRAVFTTGFGLAVAISPTTCIPGAFRQGITGPISEVRAGVKTTSHSTVSVTVNGEMRRFRTAGITFPEEHGRQASVHGDRVVFAGYGLDAPGAGPSTFAART